MKPEGGLLKTLGSVRSTLAAVETLARHYSDRLGEGMGIDGRHVYPAPAAFSGDRLGKPDLVFVQRLLAAHRAAEPGVGSKMEGTVWPGLFLAHQSALDETLRAEGREGDAIAILGNPGENGLLYGVENLTAEVTAVRRQGDIRTHTSMALAGLDGLRRSVTGETSDALVSADAGTLLQALDPGWGCPFPVPNPLPYEFGAATPRGALSTELVDAAYVAWRSSQLLAGRTGRVVAELGGGLGRVAYYARSLGIEDFTSVEVPLCRAAQAFYLGMLLGSEGVVMDGEDSDSRPRAVKLISPSRFVKMRRHFNLIVASNVLSQISEYWINAYISVAANAGILLTFDPVAQNSTVEAILAANPRVAAVHRHPSWVSSSVVERIVYFRPMRRNKTTIPSSFEPTASL